MALYVAPFGLATLLLCSAAPAEGNKATNVRVINFKQCVEQSKVGKQEQTSFEALKKQMETVLEEKEKEINELAKKLEDGDFLDSLSVEAETELKRKFRQMGQEFSLLQNQYMQALNQTNYKIVQKLHDEVAVAAKAFGKKNNIDIILNDEACFFNDTSLDITTQLVAVLDENFEKDAAQPKDAKPAEHPAVEAPKK